MVVIKHDKILIKTQGAKTLTKCKTISSLKCNEYRIDLPRIIFDATAWCTD
jgi:hypothetical protein